ncbi:MAG: lamin tail domain-containing protein [Myxococcota bacterium]|nr:lamin tail domain-containing protein [Myxococcota bacterium]
MPIWQQRTLSIAAILFAVIWGGLLYQLGIQTTADSVAYLTGSLSLVVEGKIWLSPLWPPLYPSLIYFLTCIVTYPTKAAAMASALSFGLILFSVQRISVRATGDFLFSLTLLLFCAGWWELFYVLKVAWSESLYAGMTVLHLLFIIRHIQNQSLSDYIGAAVTVGLVVLTRYIGYSLLGIFCLYTVLWLFWYQKATIRTYARYGMIIVLSNAPLITWIGFNRYRSGTLHGSRLPAERDLSSNIQTLIDVLGSQLLATPFLFSLLLVSLCCIALIWRKDTTSRKQHLLFGIYVVAYLSLYLVLLLYGTSTVKMDQINPRFLSPILPATLLLIVIARGGLQVLAEKSPTLPPYMLKSISIIPSLLLGIGLLAGLNSNQRQFKLLTYNVDREGWHTGVGFESSTTIDRLRALLEEQLESRDTLGLLVITKHKKGNRGRILMMRQDFLNGGSLQLKKYKRFNSKVLEAIVAQEDRERRILQWTHPQLSNAYDIEPMLMKMHRETAQKEFLVLTTNKVLRALQIESKDLSKLEFQNFTCETLAPADGYKAYLCSVQIGKNGQGESISTLKTGDLLITEFMANPTQAVARKGEWLEIYNNTEQAVDLKGLILTNRKKYTLVIDHSLLVEPRTHALLAPQGNPVINGGLPRVDFVYSVQDFRIRRRGNLTLSNGTVQIDSIQYALGKGMPNGQGSALMRPSLLPNDASPWCEAHTTYGKGDRGSPKEHNPPCKTP